MMFREYNYYRDTPASKKSEESNKSSETNASIPYNMLDLQGSYYIACFTLFIEFAFHDESNCKLYKQVSIDL
ncbi:hypothetical protein L1987_02652 [Smallanthus sonchifolius]|uniref:Uncharacterized protein n=1 Tax=Smallanthus sonchifolius TaxID=185202 RepID=A0ACB9K8J9_9ASTR|nr:hypothetical protein L1987_02652 [Smallanthus sonchifolius]